MATRSSARRTSSGHRTPSATGRLDGHGPTVAPYDRVHGRGRQCGQAGRAARRAARAAPGPDLTHSFVRESLHRAIHGVGPLPPAARAADKQLEEQHGHVGRAVGEVIENHVRYAGAQGLLTGLGGVVTATVTIPANLAGLALVQARMVAGIAHLHGYDLDDPRVRNAILTCMLGRQLVDERIKTRTLPGRRWRSPPPRCTTRPRPGAGGGRSPPT